MYFRLLAGKIERATKHSAAFDLFYNGLLPLVIDDRPVAIPTGVKTAFDPKLVAIIKEKSGLALKGIQLFGGVIDADYQDEWKVIARFPGHMKFDPKNWPPGEPPELYEKFWPDNWAFDSNKATHYLVQPGQKIAQFVLVEIPEVHFEAEMGAFLIQSDAERKGGLGSTGLNIEAKAG